jgi:hypothetical protein
LAADRAERGAWVGCIAGILAKGEHEAQLAAAGFAEVSVTFTHQVGDGLRGAIIKATKPTDAATQPPRRRGPRRPGRTTACVTARLLLTHPLA